MRLIDVNLLIYAHSPSARLHKESKAWLDELRKSQSKRPMMLRVIKGFKDRALRLAEAASIDMATETTQSSKRAKRI